MVEGRNRVGMIKAIMMIIATGSVVAGWIVSFELWGEGKPDSKLYYIPITLFTISLILDMISIIVRYIA